MNSFVKSLIQPILEQEGQNIALVPGGFKPPTVGHFSLVDEVAKNSNIDKVIVLIGHKNRDGVSKEESLAIWDIYKKYLPANVEIQIADNTSPIADVNSLIKNNPQNMYYPVVGIRGEMDLGDLKRFDSMKDKYDNFKPLVIRSEEGENRISGTNTRAALIGGEKERFQTYLPTELTDEEKDKVWSILTKTPLNEMYAEPSKFSYPPMIKSLTEYMLDKGMNIRPLPKVKFVDDDAENAQNFFGKTAYYDPNNRVIVLYTMNRHPKDVMRSYAHEMIHHMQNCNGKLQNITTQNTNEEGDLPEIEREAYEKGNMTFRNWTDTLTEKKNKDPFGLNQFARELVKELEEEKDLAPFDYDQDGNESRIGRDINNKKGWRRLGSNSAENAAIKKYLDKYTSGYKWSNPPKSERFEKENNIMYKTPYIMYVHLLQTSEGKNNVIDALKGMIANEPEDIWKQVQQALVLVFAGKEDQFKKVYEQYKDMIENNAKSDDGANPFAALKYAYENFSDKEGIFKKFVRNGWSTQQFIKINESLLNEGRYDKISNTISSKIFKQWREDINNGALASRFEDSFEFGDEEISIDANITVVPGLGKLNVDGGANDEDDYIEVRFEIDPEKLPEFWEEISMNLKDVIRHEIEHLTHGEGFTSNPAKTMDDDMFIRQMIDMEMLPRADYFKLEKEIDANLQGMYFRAKKEKRPFGDVINTYLDAQDITPEQKEEILDLWRRRSPALNLPKF